MFIQIYEEKYMRFFGGKAKAATFSYDDGVRSDKRLISVLDEYGLKGTFNLNSELFGVEQWHGRMGEEETIETYINTPHEVAMHGARHIFMNRVPLPEAINEAVKNRLYLENKFKRVIRGMAYAYNGYNENIISALKACGVAYARTTESSHSFALPDDWLRLKPTCHHGDGLLPALTDKFLKAQPQAEFKNRESLLFYVWGHSYEFDDHNNWEVIEDLAKKLSNDSEEIWFATNIEIYDYIRAYNNLEFSIDGERVKNPSAIPVWVEIRGKTYKVGSGEEITFGA